MSKWYAVVGSASKWGFTTTSFSHLVWDSTASADKVASLTPASALPQVTWHCLDLDCMAIMIHIMAIRIRARSMFLRQSRWAAPFLVSSSYLQPGITSICCASYANYQFHKDRSSSTEGVTYFNANLPISVVPIQMCNWVTRVCCDQSGTSWLIYSDNSVISRNTSNHILACLTASFPGSDHSSSERMFAG